MPVHSNSGHPSAAVGPKPDILDPEMGLELLYLFDPVLKCYATVASSL